MRHRCQEGEELDLEVIHLRNRVDRQEEQIEALKADVRDLFSLVNPVGPAVSISIEAQPIGES